MNFALGKIIIWGFYFYCNIFSLEIGRRISFTLNVGVGQFSQEEVVVWGHLMPGMTYLSVCDAKRAKILIPIT